MQDIREQIGNSQLTFGFRFPSRDPRSPFALQQRPASHLLSPAP